ncbi:hypothetical protein HPP92_001803 [Vanilla planifolia]|uniref:Uncharacterized protein n=1 Tax=Vanilla planifolia TaxID=51239 RepID=A0A835S424_VANPL|nr:hypothetical protein HPP92_001803 [Vanilla planifolia]
MQRKCARKTAALMWKTPQRPATGALARWGWFTGRMVGWRRIVGEEDSGLRCVDGWSDTRKGAYKTIFYKIRTEAVDSIINFIDILGTVYPSHYYGGLAIAKFLRWKNSKNACANLNQFNDKASHGLSLILQALISPD